MQVVHDIPAMFRLSAAARFARKIIGCVPTMGALHAGHGALIEQAAKRCDFVVVTIFVNPIQFDRAEDYQRYTRNAEADRAFCAERGVHAIFAPDAATMYPEPLETFVEVPELARELCGAFRPGHFRGVATVVAKLLHIVGPDYAFFGEKDAQQLAVIRRMLRDLNFPLEIVPVRTVREPDGLALSSRNTRLSAEDRAAAPVLFRALSAGERLIAGGERNAASVRAAVGAVLAEEPRVEAEYVEVVDERMQPMRGAIDKEARLMAAIWIGGVRLIDNVSCTPGHSMLEA